WINQIEWIFDNVDDVERKILENNIVYNLFVAINVELNRHTDEINLKKKDRAWAITCRFWCLIARHALTERSVGFYADLLNVTPDYLSKVCRKAYGISPQGLIHQQLLVDMKSYLSDTKLPVREIADRMKFEDVSYMCRFFKRMTGLTPLEFRHGKTVRHQRG
ncbi:MAG: helix-turn-helix transcriptional regulator, partial [Bacteroidales bacterium]|nr:helix-turn-helix transcriptional regulator [Bacteroidales bacterium]